MQFGRTLLLVLDAHAQRPLKTFSCIDDDVSVLALEDSIPRGVPHLEFTSGYFGGGYNLKIPGRHEVPDFQLALAHNCQRRRLHPANSDHAARTLPENDRRSASEGEVVNLVSLTTCYCRGGRGGNIPNWVLRDQMRPGLSANPAL